MFSRCQTVLSLAALLVAAQAPRTQDAPPTPAFSLGGSAGVGHIDGVLGAAGSDYKAVFERAGVVFTPALGQEAPRSYPLRWALESIHRGENEVFRPDGKGAPPEHDGYVVTYARTAAIAERYEARPEGLEQSFVFDEPLPGRGDLVVRVRIATDLEPAMQGETRDGISFDSPSWGGVRIGKVTGIDARGERVTGSLRLAGRTLDLVLPAAFVDAATYPLVLDPLVGPTITINNSQNNDYFVDVAYDASNDVFLVVWTRLFSSVDSDLYAQRVRSGGTLRGAMILVTNNNSFARAPSVANVNGTDQFVVVWGQWNNNDSDILAKRVDAATGAISGKTTIAGNPLLWEDDPDVGGNVSTLASLNRAVIVWRAGDNGIKGQAVTLAPGFDPIPFLSTFDITTDNRDVRPKITKAGYLNRHVVVWQRNGTTALVRAACVSDLGQVLHSLLKLGTTNFHRRDPDIDGDGTEFLVAYRREESTGSTFNDIYGRMVRWDGSALVQTVGETRIQGAPAVDELRPVVAFAGTKYLLAHEQVSTLGYRVMVVAVDRQGCIPCSGNIVVSTQYDNDLPAIASQRSGSTTPGDDRALIVYHQHKPTFPEAHHIYGRLVEETGNGGAISNLGGGCGAGNAGTSGAFALGNTDFSFDLANIPAGASQVWLNLNSPVTPVSCGACQFIPPFVMLPVPFARRSASLPLSLPCNVALIGARLEAQWWEAGVGSAPCFPGLGLTFSDIIRATVGT